ncbi:uncharacterized protein LOC134072888 isoform X1 [Sardina pilchardus]|uniref:uncharacterized protein LOC134072888 isoform X1 n=1 Tax=Sardina pilchardus TaxID=27697 RepID=UPI002E153FED
MTKTTIPTTSTTTTTTSTTTTSRSPSTYSTRRASSSNSEPTSTSSHSLSTDRKETDSTTTSSSTTNHTTPSQHHTTDWTSTPNRVHSDPPEPTTSSISKHTPAHQEGSTTTPSDSTGTTPYPLWPYWLDWVPGWGIALLVLASLILLLLIILIVLLLLRWCCMDEPEMEPQPRFDPYTHEPHHVSQTPPKTPILRHMTPEKPRGNRTGMYVVNHGV